MGGIKETSRGRTIRKPPKYRTTDSEGPPKKIRKSNNIMKEMEAYFEKNVSKNTSETDTSSDDPESTPPSSEAENDESELENDITPKDANRKINLVQNGMNNEENNGSKTADQPSVLPAPNIDINTSTNKVTNTSAALSGSNTKTATKNTRQNGMSLTIKGSLLTFYNALENKFDEKMNEIQEYARNSIDNMVKECREKLQGMEGNNQVPDIFSLTLPDEFPIKTLEDFDTFEKNSKLQAVLKNHCALWATKDINSTVRQLIKDSLSEEIVNHFKWVRISDKEDADKEADADTENNPEATRTLFNTKYSIIIYGGVRKALPNTTLEEFSSAMRAGLRAAKQRKRDQVLRKKRRQNLEKSENNYMDVMRQLYEQESPQPA